jgi:thiol:disulfide interchange protein
VISAFETANVAYLKGDWTHRDPAITRMLATFGRNGVPLYVFYPAGAASEPVVLPQILTPEIVLREIGQTKSARIQN